MKMEAVQGWASSGLHRDTAIRERAQQSNPELGAPDHTTATVAQRDSKFGVRCRLVGPSSRIYIELSTPEKFDYGGLKVHVAFGPPAHLGAPLAQASNTRPRPFDRGRSVSVSRLPAMLPIRYHWVIMRLLVPSRRAGWPTALFLAALLVVPAVDCSLVREHSHLDGHHAPAAASPMLDAHDFLNGITTAAHCDVDALHCTVKAIPPGIVTLVFSLLMLAAITAVFAATPLPPAGGVGIRGPPGRPRSPCGRTILSLHCIARR